MASTTRNHDRQAWIPVLLAIGVSAIGFAFVVRTEGRWAENDSALFTEAFRAIAHTARLTPPNGEVYSGGYLYQLLGAWLMAATGFDAAALQQFVMPALLGLTLPAAWAAMHALTGSRAGAALGSALLFAQPEFLFVLLRSSHEKYSRVLFLLLLFWIAHAMRQRSAYATSAICCYLTLFALIAANAFLAHSFTVALLIVLVLGWLVTRDTQIVRRVAYTLGISFGLVYLMMFVIYPTSGELLRVVEGIMQRLRLLFFAVDPGSTTPYAQVQSAWISLPVYLLLSLANWLTLAAGCGIWLVAAVRAVRGQLPEDPGERLMLLLFTAFGIQGALAIIADLSGAIGGNLQLRLLPSLAIIAVGLIARALTTWQPQQRARVIARVGQSVLAVLVVLAVLKATNEPLVSNKWVFYRPDELAALDWADIHLGEGSVWTEFDDRLTAAYRTARGAALDRERFTGFVPKVDTRTFLLSEVIVQRAARLQRPVPIDVDAHRVYDNGASQLYRSRAHTIYQR